MTDGQRVKDAAEADRYGYRQRGGRDGMTIVAAPTGVFSILGRVQGRVGKGNHFAAWQEPNLFTTEVRAGSGHCDDRRPHQQRRWS
jgi:hypothetical protein